MDNTQVLTAIRNHHDQLARELVDRSVTVQDAVDRLQAGGDGREALVSFLNAELLPHALAEEQTLYLRAADLPETRLLVQAMVAEHRVLEGLIEDLASARTPGRIAGAAEALRTLFLAHLVKENELLLPALDEAGVALAPLLEGMHELLGEEASGGPAEKGATADGGGCGCGGCGCGGADGADGVDRADGAARAQGAGAVEPAEGDLDVRVLAPAQRHTQIFQTFAGLGQGEGFVLVNDHDPKPLYYQFAAEHPGDFTWDYLEDGPHVWRVRIARTRTA